MGFRTHLNRQVPYEIGYTKDLLGKQGLFAKRFIQKGELIVPVEEKPRKIVTAAYAHKHFRGIHLEYFKNYAYPLSDRVFVMWSDDPDDWGPLNHSCEPNIGFAHGEENTYALRDIVAGEQITIDYCMYVTSKTFLSSAFAGRKLADVKLKAMTTLGWSWCKNMRGIFLRTWQTNRNQLEINRKPKNIKRKQ